MIGKKIKAFVKISRAGNCLMAGIEVIIAAMVGIGIGIDLKLYLSPILLAFLAAVFITAGGNAINDYFDWEIDEKSQSHKKRERPIPSGKIVPTEAMEFAIVCFAIGSLAAIFINLLSCFIAVINVALLSFYSQEIKKSGFPGNITISYLVGSTVLFGGAAVGNITAIGIWILFALVFFANLGREIIKDIEDISGDKGKRETLPMKIGIKKSVIIADCCIIFAVILSPLPLIYNVLGLGYLLVIGADIIFIWVVLVSFKNARENAHRAQQIVKYGGMFTALIAFLLGVIL